MATDNKELASRLHKAGAPMVPSAFYSEVGSWYIANKKQILALTGSQEKASQFIANAFTSINRIPKILECERKTFFECLLQSMTLNLSPGPLQECVYLPFKNVCTFVPMYPGLVKLIYNTGMVKKVQSKVVYECDEFEYEEGSNERIHYKSYKGNDRFEYPRIGAFTIITNIFGGENITFRDANFIQSIKDRSPAAQSSFSAWNSKFPTDVDGMWIKTSFRQGVKYQAKSPQLARAIQLDNMAEEGQVFDTGNFLADDPSKVLNEIMGAEPVAKVPEQKEFTDAIPPKVI